MNTVRSVDFVTQFDFLESDAALTIPGLAIVGNNSDELGAF